MLLMPLGDARNVTHERRPAPDSVLTVGQRCPSLYFTQRVKEIIVVRTTSCLTDDRRE